MGYFSTWTERAEASLRLVAPYGLMLVLFICSVISIAFPSNNSMKAPFFLMAIYYWATYRPTLIPSWFVFSAGILADFITGLPLGLSALIYVVVQWLVTDQRRFLMGQSFLMIWIGFMIVSLAAGLIQWAVFGLVHYNWPSLKPLLFSVCLGVALFPLISILLHFTHKILPEVHGNITLKTKRR